MKESNKVRPSIIYSKPMLAALKNVMDRVVVEFFIFSSRLTWPLHRQKLPNKDM